MKDTFRYIDGRLNTLINKVRNKLPKLEHLKVINIITIDVHSRDCVDNFNIKKIAEAESFTWLAQLKFYWENKADSDMH